MVVKQQEQKHPDFRVPLGARRRVARVGETFLTEVGVLLFVFPLLDEYVQYGKKALTPTLAAASISASIVCFGTACLIAAFTTEGETE